MTTDGVIAHVESRIVTLHNPTLATSYGAGKVERQHVFVKITAKGGAWGIGEGSPLPHFTGEYAATIHWAVENVLGPALIGASVMDMAGIQTRLERAAPRNGTAKNALVTAAYDLAGRETARAHSDRLGHRHHVS
jgi:L-alanine-DL-glutamate epimerase-like enolase superfamily enzyme